MCLSQDAHALHLPAPPYLSHGFPLIPFLPSACALFLAPTRSSSDPLSRFFWPSLASSHPPILTPAVPLRTRTMGTVKGRAGIAGGQSRAGPRGLWSVSWCRAVGLEPGSWLQSTRLHYNWPFFASLHLARESMYTSDIQVDNKTKDWGG